MPPRGNNTAPMQLCGLPKVRPISCNVCPAFQRLQTSPFSTAESPKRIPGLIQHHLYRADLPQMVLHRPVECTPLTGQVQSKLEVYPERDLFHTNGGSSKLAI